MTISSQTEAQAQVQTPIEISGPEYYRRTLLNMLETKEIIETPINYDPESEKVAVIIDPRYDDIMKAVIYNFMYFLNSRGWNLMIISYEGHEKTIKKDFPRCLFKRIEPSLIYFKENEPNITIESYNKILLSTEFWRSIPFNIIMIFQKDCIMFKEIPEHFLEYDFSGANWYNPQNITFFHYGINGGFSIRKKRAMIDCLEKVSKEILLEYRKKMLEIFPKDPLNLSPSLSPYLLPNEINEDTPPELDTEDIYFSWACEYLRLKIPDPIHRTFLSIEADMNTETCVFHGWQYEYHVGRGTKVPPTTPSLWC